MHAGTEAKIKTEGTGNLGECLAFGRIAGRNAVAETPWG